MTAYLLHNGSASVDRPVYFKIKGFSPKVEARANASCEKRLFFDFHFVCLCIGRINSGGVHVHMQKFAYDRMRSQEKSFYLMRSMRTRSIAYAKVCIR